MNIGTIREIKDNENRVGLTPEGVKALVDIGHHVFVQKGAGNGAGFFDEEYADAGAQLLLSPEEVCRSADILVKVKEPLKKEYPLLQIMSGKTVYTYLHLSAVNPELTSVLLENDITAIGYETVEGEHGGLPLLHPMSEVAGVLAIQYGAQYLQKKYGGRGVTLGKITGVDTADVLVMGAGTVGTASARTAAGMGCKVTLVDINKKRLDAVKEEFDSELGPVLSENMTYLLSERNTLDFVVKKADLIIGAVLIPGAKAPQAISEEQVKSMQRGAVVVDVAIDQGGCIWGSRPTSHSDPIYDVEGKIFCCVTNMPGQAALQSTRALTNATLPHLLGMAGDGVERYIKEHTHFAKGLQTSHGKIHVHEVAVALGLEEKYQKL